MKDTQDYKGCENSKQIFFDKKKVFHIKKILEQKEEEEKMGK
jgi:hypothetical protein